MLINVYGAFLIIVEIFCCFLFMGAFAEKRKKANVIIPYFLIAILFIVDCLAVFFLSNNFWLKEIVVITVSSIIIFACFELKIVKAFILFLLFQGCGIVVDYITYMILVNIFTISMANLNEPIVNVLASAISKILLFCAVIIIRKIYGIKKVDLLTNVEWTRLSIFPIFTVLAIVAIIMNWNFIDSNRQANILIWISFGLLLMNIVIFYLINDILKREMQIRENKVFRERVKNETEMYHSISRNYDVQIKRAHEFKNQIICIVELAKGGNYAKLNDYLRGLDEEIRSTVDMIDTNNVIVNAILNSKYREGKKKGILFVIQVNDLSNLELEDEGIVIILSNLLNNAIEACEKCKEKVIKFKFVKEKKDIIISVQNSMEIKPNVSNGKYVTTKKDSESHGFGIENIISTVKKYYGTYVIEMKEKEFKFSIIIPRFCK